MKKSVATTITVTVLFLVFITFIAGCNRNAPQQFEKIVIGAETGPRASPLWIAEHKGYFREEGITVEIKEFESGRTALRMMLTTEGIDIVTAAQMPVVSNSFSRNDYAIIGNMVYSDNAVKILARQDKGIQAPSDLKGKIVGITAGSSGHFFLGLFLTHQRLLMSDVKTIDMEATRLSQALVDGQVDAIATWEPHIYKAEKALGNKALIFPSKGVYRVDYYFIARKDFIKNHPQALKRFLRAINKGEEFILKNRKEAMDIVAQRLKMEREIIEATWGVFQFRLFLDQSIVLSLEDEARWTIRNKLTDATKVPNYLDYIYVDALKEVNPMAVTMADK